MDGNFNLVILGALFRKLCFLSRFLPYLTKHLREFFFNTWQAHFSSFGELNLFSLYLLECFGTVQYVLWSASVLKKIKNWIRKMSACFRQRGCACVLLCCGFTFPLVLCRSKVNDGVFVKSQISHSSNFLLKRSTARETDPLPPFCHKHTIMKLSKRELHFCSVI